MAASRALATRCPACGTVFRVVPDQLRVVEGWVRCGRCTEVFNAASALVDTDTGEIYAIANVTRGEEDGVVAVTSANLAAVEAFEPGSVAKVFSISAVLDTGVASPDTVVSVPGKIVFEIVGVPEELAREAFRLAAAKLPLRTTFVSRMVGQ